VTLAILIPVLAVLGWWITRDDEPVKDGPTERPIVAVLPFENLGSSDEEYFATGITDEITSRLALIDGLGVISRTSARVYANSEKSTQEVAHELGADYVLEGAIRWDKSREPGRVRISPRLIRVEDDTYLWTDNYEREVTEIFTLQAMIASRIADALDVALLAPVRQALDTRPTESIEAYQAYLQGLKLLDAPGFSEESFRLGVQMFERAIAADPNFALAHARLSSMHARLYHYGYDRSDARRLAALEAAERALALEPGLAAARLSLGYYYYWCAQDYARALEELETAQRLEPNNTRIWLAMAYVHRRQGDLGQAAELLESVHALNPLDANVETALGETYSTLRRYADAEPPLQRAFALVPDDPYPCTELALVYLRWRADTEAARATLEDLPAIDNAESYRVRMLVALFDRQFAEALAVLDEFTGEAFESAAYHMPVDLWRGLILRSSGEERQAREAFEKARATLASQLSADELDHRTQSALGLALAGLGRRDEAVLHGERAVELYPLTRDALAAPAQIVHLALIQAMLGNADAAVELLAEALSIPSTISVAWIEGNPLWDGIRDAPGYAELIEP
jgi:TolB-like protein/Flp pilus assembly protein TadD